MTAFTYAPRCYICRLFPFGHMVKIATFRRKQPSQKSREQITPNKNSGIRTARTRNTQYTRSWVHVRVRPNLIDGSGACEQPAYVFVMYSAFVWTRRGCFRCQVFMHPAEIERSRSPSSRVSKTADGLRVQVLTSELVWAGNDTFSCGVLLSASSSCSSLGAPEVVPPLHNTVVCW